MSEAERHRAAVKDCRARLATAIEEGLEDERLGRLYDIEEVLEELLARYDAMIAARPSLTPPAATETSAACPSASAAGCRPGG